MWFPRCRNSATGVCYRQIHAYRREPTGGNHVIQKLCRGTVRIRPPRRSGCARSGPSYAASRASCSTCTTVAATCASRRSPRGGNTDVPIGQIRGSEGRCEDFDRAFHPLKEHTEERWVSVARAHLRGLGLPPVELIQLGDALLRARRPPSHLGRGGAGPAGDRRRSDHLAGDRASASGARRAERARSSIDHGLPAAVGVAIRR